MRHPPSAGPSAVEWTATAIHTPLRSPRRMTTCSWWSPIALHPLAHGREEPGGLDPVERAVIPRQAQVAHGPHGDGVAGHHHRPFGDRLEVEDRDLRLVDDRRRHQ